MQQQFVSQQISPYPATSAIGVQSLAPQAQSVVPQIQTMQMPSIAIPQVQSMVPQVVPSMAPQVPVVPYVQPIGSRHPIEQNHIGLGLAPGSFSTVGGSPYGRISQIGGVSAPGLVASTPLGGAGGNYAQYVDILRNACQGAGTNEEDIIKVIAATNNQERAMIRRLYNQKYNEDLVARLQSELSGDFREAALGSFMTPTEYDAYCLNSALKGLGTKEGVLTEIIGSRTPQELQAIKQVYAANYGELLENHVASDTSGDYQNYYLLYYKDKEELVLNLIWLDVNKMLLPYIKQEKENGVLMKIPLLESSQLDHLLN